MVQTVMKKEYYGLVFNFGYIAPEDKEQFVITVSKTAERLNRRGKLVIVSLIPGVSDAGIDYKSLGMAANFIELRSFQCEMMSGPPTPVSPIEMVREILSYSITRIDPGKILLGLPNFAYDWTIRYIGGGKSTPELISNEEAVSKAKQLGLKIAYNETVQSSFFQYTDNTRQNHEIWFDDITSMKAKLELVNKYGLAGISIWNIMNPFPAGISAINEMFEVYKVPRFR